MGKCVWRVFWTLIFYWECFLGSVFFWDVGSISFRRGRFMQLSYNQFFRPHPQRVDCTGDGDKESSGDRKSYLWRGE